LQIKFVRTREYGKTKTMIHYSKHKSLEIPKLFKLSVAKFMYYFLWWWITYSHWRLLCWDCISP